MASLQNIMPHIQTVQQHLSLAVLVIEVFNSLADALEPLLNTFPHSSGIPAGNNFVNFLQRDSQKLELADDEERQDLVLSVVAVIALVLAVFRNQKTDLIIIPQSFDRNTAQCGDFSDRIIALSFRYQLVRSFPPCAIFCL